MWKKLMGIIIVLLLVISFSGVAYADGPYSIGFHYVQKRVFEGNKSVNRLTVAMNDGDVILPENVIDNVELFVNGAPVSLGDVSTENYLAKYPRLIAPYGPAYYAGFSAEWRPEGYCVVIILDDLLANSWYTIRVTYHDEADNTYTDEIDYYYRGEVFLPVVTSKSFKYDFDQDGNFYFYWTITAKDIFNMDHTLLGDPDTYPSVRAMIDRYDNDGKIYKMWIQLPYLSSGVYAPIDSGIFDGADLIEIGIQFRTGDNSNRSFSNFKKIKLPK